MEDQNLKKKNKKINEIQVQEDIESYLKLISSSYSESEIENLKKNYSIHHELLLKHKEENKMDELVEYAENLVKKSTNLEMDLYELENRKKMLETEWKKYKETNIDLNKKIAEKEKFSKILIEKLNVFNEDKNKIAQDGAEERSKIIKETEEYVKTLQAKCEESLPERKKIIEDNLVLRKEIQETIESTISMKDLLESELKEKDKATEGIENDIKQVLRGRLQLVAMESKKYMLENTQLKTEKQMTVSKIEEMRKIVGMYNAELEKIQREIEKKKEETILLSSENYELQISISKMGGNKRDMIEEAIKSKEKIINQMISMKNLNKKLQEQFAQLVSQKEEKEKHSNIQNISEEINLESEEKVEQKLEIESENRSEENTENI